MEKRTSRNSAMMLGDNVRSERSTIYQVLEQARASVMDPSRPVTPAESMRRKLFNEEDYRPESRPSSAFHLNGSGSSDAFHMMDDGEGESNFVLSSSANQSKASFGQANMRRKKRKKKKRKEQQQQPAMHGPASSWGWGGADVESERGHGKQGSNVEEISDTTSAPFQVTVTRERAGSANEERDLDAAFSPTTHDMDDPANDEIRGRFDSLARLENNLLRGLDPSSPTELIMLKLVAVEATVGALSLGGVDDSKWNLVRESDGVTLKDLTVRVRKKVMRSMYCLMKKEEPLLQLCVARLVLRLAAAAAVQSASLGGGGGRW